MTVVTETLTSVTERSAVVTVTLAGTDGERIGEAYLLGTDETIVTSYQFRPNDSGVWTLTVPANSLITPANTVWRRTVALSDGSETTSYATVPSSTTQVWGDILTDPPGALTSSALATHIANQAAGAHVGALADSALVVKAWDGDSFEYVGGGTPVDGFTNILFLQGTDPAAATGGRDIANDLWVDTS